MTHTKFETDCLVAAYQTRVLFSVATTLCSITHSFHLKQRNKRKLVRHLVKKKSMENPREYNYCQCEYSEDLQ